MAKATTVDFSGVKDRGAFNPRKVPEGDYEAVITKVDDAPTKDDKPMYTFTIKLKKFSQNSYPYRCVIQENQLWKLRNIAVAAGINVPKKRMKFDPNKLVGKLIGVTMEDDEYERDGKTQFKSEVAAVFAASELADGADIEDVSDEGFEDDSAPAQAVAADDADETPAEEPKKKKKDKGAKEGKKKKKDKGENLEEVDVTDL